MAVVRTTLDPGLRRDDIFEGIRIYSFKTIGLNRLKIFTPNRLKMLRPSIFKVTNPNNVTPAKAGVQCRWCFPAEPL